ncbi:MAG: hypothetical protein ACRECA_11200 [Pseudolabrys sp.]
MNRVWDYIGFVIWFAGLGYIVMWLLGSPQHLVLPPSLHLVGLASAASIPVHLLLRAIGRRRRAAQFAVHPRKPDAVLRSSGRRSVHPPRPVKPRDHFGLRGMTK